MIKGVELTDEAKTISFKGIMRLENVLKPVKPESDPHWIFSRTLLLEKDRIMLEEAIKKLNTGSEEEGKGVYIFQGLMGSGKSHRLVFLYHLFKNIDLANKFLKERGLPTIEQRPEVVALNAIAQIRGYYLDEAILSRLDLNWTENRAPSKEELKELIGDKPFVIILDEIERWVNQFKDKTAIFDRNLIFLQNLSDLASEAGIRLLVFLAIYGTRDEPKSTLRRVKLKRE